MHQILVTTLQRKIHQQLENKKEHFATSLSCRQKRLRDIQQNSQKSLAMPPAAISVYFVGKS